MVLVLMVLVCVKASCPAAGAKEIVATRTGAPSSITGKKSSAPLFFGPRLFASFRRLTTRITSHFSSDAARRTSSDNAMHDSFELITFFAPLERSGCYWYSTSLHVFLPAKRTG